MSIDFSKISKGNTSNTAINPRDIFNALPSKEEGKFQYLRDVQAEVLESWFSRKDEKSLVLKMNTGSGKTIVGLLILKSCLNEKKGPAVYVVPDKYLAKQVISEAKSIGIEVTEETNSSKFLSGKAILVINIFKLVNGKSVFGVGNDGIQIKIGSLLIDDAHACLDTVEDQFTIVLEKSEEVYGEIYSCFKESLHKQCQAKALEIENNDHDVYIQVPFWSWQNEIKNVTNILLNHKNSNSLKFSWPLMKESLLLSRCVISSDRVEITPHFVPINVIPSIASAGRKIFMTATLVDDSILCSHFDITETSVNTAVIPGIAGDIGDRMILLPQVINTNLTDKDIKNFCKEFSKTINVVVIVPSEYRAKFWADEADLTLSKDNLSTGIDLLKRKNVGLTVLINRYDGIDLPKNACRLLVIDGLPTARRLIDKVETTILMGSPRKASQLIQKIEQGMGRGVRSSDDHCVVFLMGRNLTSQLYACGAIENFSPGTREQIILSEKISDQIMESDLSKIKETMMYCLNRDQNWLATSKGALASLSYESFNKPDKVIIGLRKAYNLASSNNYTDAVQEIQATLNADVEKPVKSYLKQCLAEYTNFTDSASAQEILMSAASDNPRVTKPIKGIQYRKLNQSATDQAHLCSSYLNNKFDNPNKIIIAVDDLLESLIFKPETSDIFEESLKEIAFYLGFKGQRPEVEFRRGPDVIWEVGELKYFVFECKNGVKEDVKNINKHDCNQLNGSGVWFTDNYGQAFRFTPILIHRVVQIEHAASLNEKTKIIDEEKLVLLRKNILEFIKSVCSENKCSDINFIRERIITYKLRPDDFSIYFNNFKRKK